MFHLIEKVPVTKALGSGFQEIYLSIWWFMLKGKRSNVRFPNIFEIFWNNWVFNFHSVTSLKFLKKTVCLRYLHILWRTSHPWFFCNFIAKLWFNSPFIIYIRYRHMNMLKATHYVSYLPAHFFLRFIR